MTRDSDPGGRGGELWRRARAGWARTRAADEPPDLLGVAAYLDGALAPGVRARIEAWMARSPDALDLIVAARRALAEPPLPVPESLVRRAQALVPERSLADTRSAFRRGRLPAPFANLMRPATWAGVAAALLLSAASSFELGRTGAQHMFASGTLLAEDLDVEFGQAPDDPL